MALFFTVVPCKNAKMHFCVHFCRFVVSNDSDVIGSTDIVASRDSDVTSSMDIVAPNDLDVTSSTDIIASTDLGVTSSMDIVASTDLGVTSSTDIVASTDSGVTSSTDIVAPTEVTCLAIVPYFALDDEIIYDPMEIQECVVPDDMVLVPSTPFLVPKFVEMQRLSPPMPLDSSDKGAPATARSIDEILASQSDGTVVGPTKENYAALQRTKKERAKGKGKGKKKKKARAKGKGKKRDGKKLKGKVKVPKVIVPQENLEPIREVLPTDHLYNYMSWNGDESDRKAQEKKGSLPRLRERKGTTQEHR